MQYVTGSHSAPRFHLTYTVHLSWCESIDANLFPFPLQIHCMLDLRRSSRFGKVIMFPLPLPQALQVRISGCQNENVSVAYREEIKVGELDWASNHSEMRIDTKRWPKPSTPLFLKAKPYLLDNLVNSKAELQSK